MNRSLFHPAPFVRDTLIGIFVLLALGFAVFYQNRQLSSVERTWKRFEQKMVLPDSEILKIATLGYDNIYANWLWLQSIQAFGMGWITEDMSTRPIFQYFDTLTDIDPKFISAYRFGNLIIGDNRHDWDLGQELLVKGTFRNPMNYDIPYLGLYNAIWHRSDGNEARWFASRLRRIPDAPNFMVRLEEYIERQEGRYEVAFEFNTRYYLEYLASGNEVERQIVERRMQALLDRWYKREVSLAIESYVEDFGDHPEQMEQLLESAHRPRFQAPTIERFVSAVDSHIHEVELVGTRGTVPENLVDSIVRESTTEIIGLPPDPYGTWYMIHGPSRYTYVMNPATQLEPGIFPYILSARNLIEMVNSHLIRAQMFIMEFYRENGRVPNDSEIRPLLGRDPLGGHYVYQREAPESPIFGVFFSTAARRIDERREPRLGLRGPGPFPFSIEPRLSDNEVDRRWGEEMGFILEDGTELWESVLHDHFADPVPTP